MWEPDPLDVRGFVVSFASWALAEPGGFATLRQFVGLIAPKGPVFLPLFDRPFPHPTHPVPATKPFQQDYVFNAYPARQHGRKLALR